MKEWENSSITAPMKNALKITAALLITLAFAGEISAMEFPTGPELSETPGKLCDTPSKYRYPENIAYCDRDVSWETKEAIIHEYDEKFSYSIAKMPRGEFKIDHLIPLCAGGSNDVSNLWPQHKTVYIITDPLEPVICSKMAQGRLKQKDAVNLIIEAKTNLDRTKKIIDYVSRL